MNTEENHTTSSAEETSITRATPGTPPAVRFDELSQGENEVVIEYQDQHYRLRVTKNGKLILNK
jgi:hemin uptake protein HemP